VYRCRLGSQQFFRETATWVMRLDRTLIFLPGRP